MRNHKIIGVILTLAIFVLWGCETTEPKIKGPTDIRIRNGSAHIMQNVQVGGHGFGDISPGEYSGYQEFEVAYDYASVFLTIQDTLEFSLVPIDFVGEKPLGKGKFTYTLDIFSLDSRSVNIEASKD